MKSIEITRFAVFCVVFATCCNHSFSQSVNSKEFLIEGKFFGKKTTAISYSYRDKVNNWVTKDCEITNGRFSLTGNLSGATEMHLTSTLAKGSRDDNNFVEILIEPGNMEISLVENEFKSISVKGSLIQRQYDLLEKSKLSIYTKMRPLSVTLDSLKDSIRYLVKLNDSNRINQVVKKAGSILAQMAPLKDSLNQIEMKFVAAQPNELLSAFLLEKQYSVYQLSKDTVKFYIANFSESVQKSYWAKSILRNIKRNEGSGIGANAADFMMKDMNGLNVALSAFKNKNVVLLDFWASWCIPCRNAIPHLKLSFDKYQKAGLAIIAISEDSDKEAWLKAIQNDNTNRWYHILALNDKKDISETDIGMKYEATPIPMCYLINKEGVIVGKWVGTGDLNEKEIDKKLQEIFGF